MKMSDDQGRLKIVLPVHRSLFLLIFYSLVLVIWLMMLLIVVAFIVRGESLSWVHATILIIWTILWLWFGRSIWKKWQHHVATRELLFIDEQNLIIRRPVSILGPTTVYDREFIGPFYFSERHRCPAFDYAFLHVYFGQSLEIQKAKELVRELNHRYFPEVLAKEQ